MCIENLKSICDWSLIIWDYKVMRIRRLTSNDGSVNFILFDDHFIGYDFEFYAIPNA